MTYCVQMQHEVREAISQISYLSCTIDALNKFKGVFTISIGGRRQSQYCHAVEIIKILDSEEVSTSYLELHKNMNILSQQDFFQDDLNSTMNKCFKQNSFYYARHLVILV